MANSDWKMELNAANILAVLQPGGVLSQTLKNFESRPEQQEMTRNVIDAYNDSHIAIIEAGTGTGKSIAYLLPAMIWAAHGGEKTLISTNTITLQEQLLHKDVPLLSKALGLNIKAILVKGMSNYVCLRKLHEVEQELPLFPSDESQELQKITAWGTTTKDGSRADLSFNPRSEMWEKVCAESDTCNREECPFFKECYFFKARKEAQDAHILISNHSLLFSDLSFRKNSDNGGGILPDYQRLILDEAHNIEDIATEHFATRVSTLHLLRVLSRLSIEKQGKTYGKLAFLKNKILDVFRVNLSEEIKSILMRLEVDIPSLKHEAWEKSLSTLQHFTLFMESMSPEGEPEKGEGGAKENKLRLLPKHLSDNSWNDEIVPRAKHLIDAFNRYIQSLSSLEADIKALNNPTLNEQTGNTRLEITALTNRLALIKAAVEDFITPVIPKDRIRWIESYQTQSFNNVSLVNANLDISQMLIEDLFTKFPTVILCSATLTTNNQFNFIRERLGLSSEDAIKKKVTENRYESPFNYADHSLLAIPTDMPQPSHASFSLEAVEKIWMFIQASRGNAFVLFTSYTMLKYCHARLEKRMKEHRYISLKQGDANRLKLLQQFKSTDRSVLFGTDSFWEGVDVDGEALRCVIIVKLPFQVPSEPIIQARTEAILARGGNPFMEYAIPNAIVKFKQGFGRLIRKKNDRGCIVCLDPRIISKGYGNLFLNSLPECQRLFVDSKALQAGMLEFYKKTHYLTKLK